MTLEEIIHIEDPLGDKIHLYREGLFWKAYEYSAYRFFFGINRFKPLKKSVKKIGKDVVSIGFPTTSLEKFCQLYSVLTKEDHHLLIVPKNIVTMLSFVQWKDGILLTPIKPKLIQESSIVQLNVEDEILRFNIESKTPIECMTWLSSLKQKIKEASNG